MLFFHEGGGNSSLMIPRSAAGRAIAASVDTGVAQVIEQSSERVIKLKKKNKEALLGVRCSLHPVSGQGACVWPRTAG